MTERTYPFICWVLQPSFKPKQVQITSHYYAEWYQSDNCHNYQGCDMFPTQEKAIAEGRTRLATQEALLARRQANIDKRRAALDKAEAKLNKETQ